MHASKWNETFDPFFYSCNYNQRSFQFKPYLSLIVSAYAYAFDRLLKIMYNLFELNSEKDMGEVSELKSQLLHDRGKCVREYVNVPNFVCFHVATETL